MERRPDLEPVFWLDAQLPPQLAPWLTERFGVRAYSASYLGLRDATDEVIFEAARAAAAVIISKDSDFIDKVRRHGPPPKLLWVTVGNVTTLNLKTVFDTLFVEAVALLMAGEDIVEIGQNQR